MMNITMIGAKNFEEVGGIEVHIQEISKRLVDRGHRVNTIMNNMGRKTTHEIIDGINVYTVPYIHSRYTTKLSMLPPLLWKARKLESDIYHAHDVVGGFGSALFLNTKPLIYTAHGIGYVRSDWAPPVRLSLWTMEQIIFRRADKLLTVDYQSKEILNRIRDDVPVIHNGVDLDRFKEKKDVPPEFSPDKLRVLFAGRLIPTKGAHLLIDSFNDCDAELYIIGKGPEEEKLKKMIATKDNVKFIGYVKDIVPYFQHADIFVLPSIYEGLPITLLEAMASSNACIATDIADLSQRFKNGDELILVEPGNEEVLSRALSDLINDKKKRRMLARNAKNKMKEGYDWDNIVDRIEEIYKESLR
jgi:glycosyltransferase involved in cell wall biosynthesis